MCGADVSGIYGDDSLIAARAVEWSVLLGQIAGLEAESFTDAWSVSVLKDTLSYDYNMLLAAYQTAEGHLEIDVYRGLPEDFSVTTRRETAGYLIADLLGDESELLRIAVKSSLRGRGVGGRLMEVYRETLRDCCGRYLLEVRAGNTAAIALYEKWGYRPIHVRRNYYSNPTEDAVIYECIPERGLENIF